MVKSCRNAIQAVSPERRPLYAQDATWHTLVTMSRYLVPKGRHRVEIRVSNSRFITTVAPVSTVKEAQAFIRAIREEMPDATHHVYAFKVGFGASVSEGMSDDGEPSGTSGPPTMAVLRGANIGDAAIVTTRYFGGTKLGTGGLVSAYGAAAKAVLDSLETEEKVTRHRGELTIPYALRESVRRLLDGHECLLEDESFEADVRLRYLIPEEREADFAQAIRDLSSGKIVPRRME